jgi:hypothetical protein
MFLQRRTLEYFGNGEDEQDDIKYRRCHHRCNASSRTAHTLHASREALLTFHGVKEALCIRQSQSNKINIFPLLCRLTSEEIVAAKDDSYPCPIKEHITSPQQPWHPLHTRVESDHAHTEQGYQRLVIITTLGNGTDYLMLLEISICSLFPSPRPKLGS